MNYSTIPGFGTTGDGWGNSGLLDFPHHLFAEASHLRPALRFPLAPGKKRHSPARNAATDTVHMILMEYEDLYDFIPFYTYTPCKWSCKWITGVVMSLDLLLTTLKTLHIAVGISWNLSIYILLLLCIDICMICDIYIYIMFHNKTQGQDRRSSQTLSPTAQNGSQHSAVSVQSTRGWNQGTAQIRSRKTHCLEHFRTTSSMAADLNKTFQSFRSLQHPFLYTWTCRKAEVLCSWNTGRWLVLSMPQLWAPKRTPNNVQTCKEDIPLAWGSQILRHTLLGKERAMILLQLQRELPPQLSGSSEDAGEFWPTKEGIWPWL